MKYRPLTDQEFNGWMNWLGSFVLTGLGVSLILFVLSLIIRFNMYLFLGV